eukprot:c28781_g1_i1 orf=166-1779(+)
MDGCSNGLESVRRVLMWGYLPAFSVQRGPLDRPMAVPAAVGDEGWKSICSGGCGFALAISESGKLSTWGSTDDIRHSYITSGKHQLQPEPFPLQTDAPIIHAAAGWAHCVAATDRGEVYTWGWKECVPTGKSTTDQAGNSFSSTEKVPYENHEVPKDRGEEGPLVQTRFNEQLDYSESSPGTLYETACKVIPNNDQLSTRLQGGLPSSSEAEKLKSLPLLNCKSQSCNQIPLGYDKPNDEVSKKRRLITIEQTTSPESSTTCNDENVSAPPCLVALPSGVKFMSVAAGGRHTLALSDTGHVWGWGYGGEGQLGLGSRIGTVSSPHPVPFTEAFSSFCKDIPSTGCKENICYDNQVMRAPGTYVKAVACGGRHSAVLTDAGALLTFGWGLYGQCGQGSTEDELSPCYVSYLGGLHVTGVAAGLWHTTCITDTGDVYSFGGNQFGQLGTGGDKAEVFPRLIEAPVLENQHAVSVSCGARHSAVCTDNGNVFCWGWNKYGQLGVGDALDRNIPAEVQLDNNFAWNVSCGWWHTLALVSAK